MNRLNELIEKLKLEGLTIEKEDKALRIRVSTAEELVNVLNKLKMQGFDHIKSITATDLPDRNVLEVSYILGSYSHDKMYETLMIITISLSRDNPVLPSISEIFPSSVYHERECYEMFGIKFEGHRDQRHLLLSPEDFTGIYPLRKEFKIEEEGIRG